jgi:hypothetical protein
MVAAFVIEMCGWERGTPVLHPIPYRDPVTPGRYGTTPAWLMRTVLQGARDAGAPFKVGDPLISWLYQPGVRTFRADLYGDDLSFIQAGLPAVFTSDSSFAAFYPWYHQPSDTKDKLSAVALERMGASVLGALRALGRAPRPDGPEPQWFVAFGRVIGVQMLWLIALVVLLPGLVLAARGGGVLLGLRGAQAALFALVMWRHPVPAVFVLALPTLLAVTGSRLATALGLLPALGLASLAFAGYQRGMLGGTWLAAWPAVALLLALVLPFAQLKARTGGRSHGAAKSRAQR